MRISKSTLVVALAGLALLATAANDQPVKVGVVDLDQALLSTDEGKAARDELERKQREAQAKIEPMINRLKELEEEVKSKQFVLSDEALRQKMLDAVELRSDIEAKGKELEGKFKVDSERILGPLRKKMIDIVQGIGKDQGFTLIMLRGSPGLLYAREALDITDMVTERFNRKG